jgi:thiamine kinase-like enzyme
MTIDNNIHHFAAPQEAGDNVGRHIKLFETHGYYNVNITNDKRSNDVFFAEKDGQDVFIKKYREHDKSAELRVVTEVDCYKNLPQENLLDLVETSSTDKYLVLKKAELINIAKNEDSVREILSLYLNKLAIVDSSFLSEVNWDDYEKLFIKLKTLEHLGIIDGADHYIKVFTDKKELIEKSQKVFAHHDFNFSNIKDNNGRVVVFDFEHASCDNAMYDPATLYIDICGEDSLREVFEGYIKNHVLYNKELFDLMLVRRCVDVMHGLKDSQEVPYFQKNKDVLDDFKITL